MTIEDVDSSSAFIQAVDYAGTKYAWGTWGVEALGRRASLNEPVALGRSSHDRLP